MGKVRDYQQLAHSILEAVGGEDNVISAVRCATRLRLVLKRSDSSAKETVSALLASLRSLSLAGSFKSSLVNTSEKFIKNF